MILITIVNQFYLFLFSHGSVVALELCIFSNRFFFDSLFIFGFEKLRRILYNIKLTKVNIFDRL